MNVAIIGTGHVGLISCGSFAEIVHHVVGTDGDPETMGLLERGIPPFSIAAAGFSYYPIGRSPSQRPSPLGRAAES